MFFAKLHPLLVHFPMALLVSGTLFELFGKLQHEEAIVQAGRFNIRFGFWSALPVIGVGAMGARSLDITPKFKDFLVSHMLLAFLTAGLFAALLILNRFRTRQWVNLFYYLCLVLGLAGILATGFYGGELVHRFDLPAGGIATNPGG